MYCSEKSSKESNVEPAVLVHYVALLGNHSIVQITHFKRRCGSLVTQCPLSLLMSIRYQLLKSMTSISKPFWKKSDCTDLWVIKLTNQVLPSSGFRVPH